ncbi:MAG: hydrogenase 4 subunit B, partial [Rhodocyclaceae bacterium]
LSGWCIALGVLPTLMIQFIDPVTRALVGTGLGERARAEGWLLLAPMSIERASYGPLLFLLGILAGYGLAFILVRLFYHGRLRRAPAWDCGYPWQTPRMQDTAEGFGQPIRQIFESFFRVERHLPKPTDSQPFYKVILGDHFWHWLYLPIARLVEFVAQQVGRLQRGRIAIYLLYSFLTLLFMMLVVPR